MERKYEPEQQPEQKEYTFEEGVEKAVEIIKKLLETQPFVVIGIGGALTDKSSDDSDIGKTTLKWKICLELDKQEIPHTNADHIDQFSRHTLRSLKDYQKLFNNNKGVIIFGAEIFFMSTERDSQAILRELKRGEDCKIEKLGQRYGLPITKFDLRILIYRPDQEIDPNLFPSADIAINNHQAKRKLR